MQRTWMGTIVVLTATAVSHAAEPAREGPWILNDLPAAQAEAKRTGKPIFVVFRCER
ncbi:MAG: thioredoxin family protein [Gemmataceae bacterium]|nr:thioredoxin family protein [Gemmataceae bacterium]